jgi:hypothetical protein
MAHVEQRVKARGRNFLQGMRGYMCLHRARGLARGLADRVMLVNVVGRPGHGVAVDRPVFGVGERLLLPKTTQIHLPASTRVVARRAADETVVGAVCRSERCSVG